MAAEDVQIPERIGPASASSSILVKGEIACGREQERARDLDTIRLFIGSQHSLLNDILGRLRAFHQTPHIATQRQAAAQKQSAQNYCRQFRQ
jgi:hypothetical protein